MELDRYYTPAEACSAAYAAWTSYGRQTRIGDFCCGDGALLRLAPFAEKLVFGLDIDADVVAKVRSHDPSWDVRAGDFLRPSAETAAFLDDLRGSLDLIVLNPPFSCRGGRYEVATIGGRIFRCTRPMAFFAKCLDLLRPDGSMMAILPRSMLRSEKDGEALEAVREAWTVVVERELPRTTFPGCKPHSVSVSVRRNGSGAASSWRCSSGSRRLASREAQLVRGCIPMHQTLADGQHPVLHTTNLRSDRPIETIDRFAQRQGRTASGVLVTVPRVGLPDARKVRLLNAELAVTLSDCLFAVAGETPAATEALLETILGHWERFESLYSSTCAPYLTIAQLKSQLSHLGWETRVVDTLAASESVVRDGSVVGH